MRIVATAGLVLACLAASACSHPPPKEYAYPSWAFAASFQAPPKVIETPASKDGSQPHSLMVEAKAYGQDFAVNATDAAQTTSTPDQILSNAPQVVASSMGVDVGAVTYAASGQVMGREVRFDKNDKPVMLMRIFLANGRLYEVSADSSKGPTDPAVKAFLDSFRLLGGAAAATNSP